ncbi:FMN-dependent NADH-azoreductase [mine drainage metagenome]|uniref:FMN-dependent NADH-azoreductase n=1 Tax=mine drainage metagenome TaxID=410659 RepID=A0A1J5T872_9ZZZZ
MKVLIVFNHPYNDSYCNAILNAVSAGLVKANHEIDLIHLDNDNFDPVMRAKDLEAFTKAKFEKTNSLQSLDSIVLDYKQRLENADYLIFIFPIWWELMPALTKGFIDKIIFPGIAYDYEKETKMICRLNNLKGVTVITTMNSASVVYRLVFGNAIKKTMLTGTFWKIGVKNRKWISLNMVKFVSANKRKKWLVNLENKFARFVP